MLPLSKSSTDYHIIFKKLKMERKMKKILQFFLIVIVVMSVVVSFSLIGCKEEVAPTEEGAEEVESAEEVAPTEEAAEEVEDGEYKAVIRIISLPWPQTPLEQQLADELFTPATGIKVELVGPPYEYVETKLREFTLTQNSDYDLYEYDSQWGGHLISNGGLERLDTEQYLLSPDSKIKFSDFDESFLTYIGKFPVDPEIALRGDWEKYNDLPLYALPWTFNTNILAYRTDLFEEAGIVDENGKAKPPKTWDEFFDACAKLTNPEEGRYAIALTNTRAEDLISMNALVFLYGWGGQLWNQETFEAEGYLNSPGSIEGIQNFVDMNLKNGFIDPAAANWGHDGVLTAVTQDKTAMWFSYTAFGGVSENPDISLTVGKWAYTPVPGNLNPETGEIEPDPIFASQGIGINAYSKNKEAAWEYIQWLNSYETQKALMDLNPAAGVTSTRKDLRDYAMEDDLTAVNVLSLPYAHDFWNYPFYSVLLDSLQRELSLAYIGAKSVEEALNDAATHHQSVLDTEKATYIE